jgi:hypothetical protein
MLCTPSVSSLGGSWPPAGELSVVSVKSEANASDSLTEALSRPLFEKKMAGMGM